MKTSSLLASLVAVLALSACSVGVSDDAEPAADESSSSTSSSSSSSSGESSDDAGVGAIANGPCDDRTFDVTQDGSELVLDGACGDVTVSASDVAINLDGADSITVTGDRVQIIVNGDVRAVTLTGEADTVNGETMGTVSVEGTAGTVIATKVDALAVSGTGNTVNWDSGTRSAQDTGTGNVIVGPSR